MKYQCRSFAVLFIFICCVSNSAEVTELHIGRDQAPSAEVDIAVKVLKKAYAKIGIVPVFEPYPLRRSLAMAASGQLDGDTMRFDQTFADNPTLIKVTPAIVEIKTIAYMRQANCPAKLTWEDLQSRRVVYELGIMLYEDRLVNAKGIHANSADDALHMLSEGIGEVAVSLEQEANLAMQSGKYKNICKVEQPVEITPLYHALNKRNAATAEKLQVVLKEMASRGEIRAIWKAGD